MTYILLKLVFVCWFEIRATNWGFESRKSIRREEGDKEKDGDDIKQWSFIVKEGGKLFNNVPLKTRSLHLAINWYIRTMRWVWKRNSSIFYVSKVGNIFVSFSSFVLLMHNIAQAYIQNQNLKFVHIIFIIFSYVYILRIYIFNFKFNLFNHIS